MTTLEDVDDFLEHHGVKGMRWGVRKENTSDEQAKPPLDKKALVKKLAIGAGTLAVVAGAAYTAHYLSKNGSKSISSLPKPAVDAGKNLVKQEVSTILHAARAKEKGFTFLKTGGVPNPVEIYEKAGFQGEGATMFHKIGSGIAARFTDPKGRLDRAGRPIFHDVIIPSSMSNNIHSLNDVVDKIWPLVKEDYDAFY